MKRLQQPPWQTVGAMWLLLLLAACSTCLSTPQQPSPTSTYTPLPTLPTVLPTPILPTATSTPIPPTATPWPISCQIAFLSDRGDERLSNIFVISADGSGLGRLDTGLEGERVTSMAWSPDCEMLAFTSEDTYGRSRAFVMKTDGRDRRRLDDQKVREGVVQSMIQVFPAYEELEQKWEAEGYSLSLSDAVRLTHLAWSPDGQQIAFTAGVYVPEGIMNFGIYIINADGSGLMRLAPDGAAAEEVFQYYEELDDGLLEWSREWIRETLEIQDWVDLLPFVVANPAWSPDGQKIAFKLGLAEKLWLYVIRTDGGGLVRPANSVVERNAAVTWSPDSGRIAFIADGGDDIYIVNADGGKPVCLTNGEAFYDSPVWSPDGKRIAFVSRPAGGYLDSSDIYVINADSSGLTNLTDKPGEDTNPVWSPDGSKIAFESMQDGNREIYVMDVDGSNQRNLTRHPVDDSAPVWLRVCAPIPTLSPAEIPTLVPTPVPTPVEFSISCDVSASLTGPAGAPASRDPETVLSTTILGGEVAQVIIELPSGETVTALPAGSYEEYQIFYQSFEGLPQAGGTYICVALDADGAPIPGGEASDVYVGGYELDPPANVKAEVIEDGILVTWDPSPTIPGGFDPSGVPPLGSYNIFLDRKDWEEGFSSYQWSQMGASLTETSHLIPFRRQHFALGDAGLALEEMDDGLYYLQLSAFSLAPEGTDGQGVECSVTDPAEEISIAIEEGKVRIE